MRNDILERKDEIIEMVNANEPKSNICKLLNCKPITLESYLKKLGIVYNGNMGLKGKKTDKNRKSAIEYAKKEIVVIPKLRKKLIEDGIKKYECELCGLSEWLGQKLSLELHHIDGNRFNNDLGNLQILCPNCHSLTPNHSGKKYKPKEKIKKIEKLCQCGSKIKNESKTCLTCYHKSLQKHIPNKNSLLEDIKNIGYSATGRKYNVSDNTIRNWVK